MTFDRHWLGDLALAVLFALSLVALAQPQATPAEARSAPSVKVGTADRLPGEGRISLLG
jgi:multidrug efflux pump subunit AcrA (membrane-fusion protein)